MRRARPARPSRAHDPAGGVFPASETSFVGRARELAELESLLAGHRLVTVVGPPGAGKTRLALRLLETRRADVAPGGAWFASLAAAAGAGDVRAAVARALGLPVQGDGPAPGELAQALAARPGGLLLLDNFEQVAATAPETIGAWLAAAPRLRVLVTSRELLHLGDEASIELLPLSVPAPDADLPALRRSEAGQLFLERAGRHAPRAADAAVIAEIVRRLEGLPLAIELAASWLHVLPPRELLGRLDRRLELLAGGPRDGPSRHSTLRAAIAWSWQLLAPWERSVVAQCSVFREGFDLEAAEAVVSLGHHPDAPSCLVAIRALLEKSLLRTWSERPGLVRLGMYETIREFVEADEATGTERAGAGARHAEHYAALANALAGEIDGARGPEVLQRLTAEYANLMSASARGGGRSLEVLVALERVVVGRMPLAGYAAMLDRALGELSGAASRATSSEPITKSPGAAAGTSSDVSTALAARARVCRSRARYALGRAAEAEADLREALALAGAAGDDAATSRALWRLGVLYEVRQEGERAREALEGALEHARRGGDPRLEAEVRVPLAHFYSDHGRHDDALEQCRQALRLARGQRSRRLEARALGAYVLVHMRKGEAEQACAAFERMLPPGREVGEELGEGYGHLNAGIAVQELGRFEEAAAHFEQANTIALRLAQDRLSGGALGNLGALRLEQGDLTGARELYERALVLVTASGARRLEGEFHAHLVALEARDGRLAEARDRLDAAAQRGAASSDPNAGAALALYRAQLDLAEARQAAARGDEGEARRLRGRVLALRPARVATSEEIRFAGRLLRNALCQDALVIEASGNWFAPPGAPRVSLARRAPMARLLARLFAHARGPSAATGLSAEVLVDASWPSERLRWDAALNRLRVSVTTLRKLGLQEFLVHRDDGYLLEPRAFLVSSDALEAVLPAI